MAVEGAAKVRLELFVEMGVDFGEGTAEMPGNGDAVHLGQVLVDADVAEAAIEEAEADRRAVVDSMELGQALGGKGLETQGHGWVGGGGVE